MPEELAARAEVAAPAGVGDIFATAFSRYGGGFLTFGLMALVAVAVPGAALGIARAAGARDAVLVPVVDVAAVIAYLSLVGAITAVIGKRLRTRLVAIVGTALLAAPAIALCVVLTHLLALLLLPFVLPPFALAPVAAGAGDASGVGACRRSISLVTRNGYRRSLLTALALVLIGAVLFFGIAVALSPLPGSFRAATGLVIWAAIFWPLSALVLRNLYGALAGRLVVRR